MRIWGKCLRVVGKSLGLGLKGSVTNYVYGYCKDNAKSYGKIREHNSGLAFNVTVKFMKRQITFF